MRNICGHKAAQGEAKKVQRTGKWIFNMLGTFTHVFHATLVTFCHKNEPSGQILMDLLNYHEWSEELSF